MTLLPREALGILVLVPVFAQACQRQLLAVDMPADWAC